MARVRRSLWLKKKRDGEDVYAHREHRATKNRRNKAGDSSVLEYKRKREELKLFGRYRKGRRGKI